MRKGIVGAVALVATIGATAAAARAAAVGVTPSSACYTSDQSVTIQASGFSPNSTAGVTLDNDPLGSIFTDGSGTGTGTLRLGTVRGVRDLTLSVADQSGLSASTTLHASGVEVHLRPMVARPGAARRISATGFVSGGELYSHVIHGRHAKTLAVGPLSGPCGALRTRARVTPTHTRPGTYTVQFDTSPQYSAITPIRVRFRLRVSLVRVPVR